MVAIEIAIRSDATDPLYVLHKCQSLMLLKRYDEALSAADAAVRLAPESADAQQAGVRTDRPRAQGRGRRLDRQRASPQP